MVSMVFDLNEESKLKLDALRLEEEERLVEMLSHKYDLPYKDLRKYAINTDALRLVPEDAARRLGVAPFGMSGKKLDVAIRTPNIPGVQDITRDLEGRGYDVTRHMVSTQSLECAWRFYKDLSFATATEAGVLDISSDHIRSLTTELTTLQATRNALATLGDMKKLYRVTRTLEIILAGALGNGASDIHTEPQENAVEVRFRLDGVLAPVITIDHDTYKAILTRIKLLSGLKINIRTSAQDGRFSVRVDTRDIEIRTSILPSNYGETIVMRLLDPSSICHGLEQLGVRPSLLEIIKREIQKPNGLILNTGPTGSGKTTTLYAFLTFIANPDIKIITIEDPIEYHMQHIVQTQVNHKDYTFASGLRSTLRQDPDVIMVGEIRDTEVAETAVHAALTGHLVFSTLHTNNAAGAFPRLIDIGINPSMAASAINVVMAQRLLRTLDPAHRKEVPLVGDDRAFVEGILDKIHDRSLIPPHTDTMWVPDVPEGEIEYRGRVGVYEAITTTRDIEDAVRKNLTIRELEEVARKQGFLSMHEDAILKVLEGVTTMEEVRRILGDSIDTAL